MPVADFYGRRNWGYDGVLPYAPDSSYGRPEEFKALIDAAHKLGIAVLLDVVYNHFGPEGNYLSLYAPEFFTANSARLGATPSIRVASVCATILSKMPNIGSRNSAWTVCASMQHTR